MSTGVCVKVKGVQKHSNNTLQKYFFCDKIKVQKKKNGAIVNEKNYFSMSDYHACFYIFCCECGRCPQIYAKDVQ
jgi:hypothetical protein